MKQKLFTLLLAVAASVGTMQASDTQVDGIWYDFDSSTKTASVTYRGSSPSSYSNEYSGTVVIPSSVVCNSETYSVTSIGASAFWNCSGLTSVTIPNSVTSIGSWAFSSCTGLTSVTIPNSVTSIGEYAFADCTGLTSIEIPNSVTSIENEAFYYCTGLTSVTIPNSVTSIGEYAFAYCRGLTSIVVENGNTVYDCRDNCNAIIETATNTLIGGCQNTIIPNSVTSIGDRAFYGCRGLTSVTIPNSVTSIGGSAFYGCRGLTSVTIPNSVTSIGNEVFYYCTGLTSIEIPNSVTSIGERAFADCTGLTFVTIPNSVTSIGSEAFERCTCLTSVTIPNSVTSIGGSAFSGCRGLTSMTIPNSVTSIGNYAFYECTDMSSVEAPAVFFNVPEQDWPSYTKNLNHVTVNGGELTENALLFINRSYKTLQTLDVSRVTNTEFADEAFKGYYNLQQLVLPAGLQKVSYMMVAGCKNLQSIDIPASVEEIEQSAFEDCRSLKSITFGGSSAGAPGRLNAPAASASQLRKIGNWAFYNAHELQNLVIPEGVEEIGDGAFYGCTYLEEMVLPSSVQTIGDNTFALCAKLKKITVNSVTPPTIQAKTFFDVKRQIPVYVPDEAVSAYEADTYWQEFDIQGASNMPTSIDNVSSSLQGGDRGRLILRNGQILILRGDKEYTLTGQEVK